MVLSKYQSQKKKCRLTVPIQRVHPRKRPLTPMTNLPPNIQMQLLMPVTVILPRKALIASRPIALERSFLVVTPQVPLQTNHPGPTARENLNALVHSLLFLVPLIASTPKGHQPLHWEEQNNVLIQIMEAS